MQGRRSLEAGLPSFRAGGFGASLGQFRVEEGASSTQIVGNDTLTAADVASTTYDYLKAADKLFPVIETDGGRVVEILITKGAVYQAKAGNRETYRSLLRRSGTQARSNDDD